MKNNIIMNEKQHSKWGLRYAQSTRSVYALRTPKPRNPRPFAYIEACLRVYELNARLRPMSGLGFGVRGFDRLVYSMLRHSASGVCALMIASKREHCSCVRNRLTADCRGVRPRAIGPAEGIRPSAREAAGSCLRSTCRTQVPSSDPARGR
jgi:hypothetical protein